MIYITSDEDYFTVTVRKKGKKTHTNWKVIKASIDCEYNLTIIDILNETHIYNILDEYEYEIFSK